jgi:hypothetical protein
MDVTHRRHDTVGRRGAAVGAAIWASKSPRRAAIWYQKVPGDPPLLEASFSLI